MNHTNDTASSIFKQFIQYVSLNILGMLGLSCYILADTFFISMGMGANGLTALNLAIPVYSFINGTGLMIGIGGATRYSLLKNQSAQKERNAVFSRSVLLAFSFAVVFFILGLGFSGSLSRMLGADGEVYHMTAMYLKIILLFSPAFIMNNVLLAFVRNDGNPGLSMTAMITGSLSNIVLDYIFIFPLGMGIFGAALATGFSPLISMGILSTAFRKKQVQFHWKKPALSLAAWGDICSLGISSLITELSSGIVMIVFNFMILRLEGNIGVAAYGVIANISLVVLAIFTGIAQGSQPVISSFYGIGNKKASKTVYHYSIMLSLLLSAIIYAVCFWGAETIVELFNKEKDPLLQTIAVSGVKLYFLGFFPAGFNLISAAYCSASGQPKPAFLISILRGLFLILPVTWVMASLLQMTGIWLSFPVTEFLTATLTFLLIAAAAR